jgi:hypothetical protein
LLDELGQPVECFFQEAALAAGADDTGREFAECARVLRHGVSQRRAFLHARMDVVEHQFQILMWRLFPKHFDRTQQRYAATQ